MPKRFRLWDFSILSGIVLFAIQQGCSMTGFSPSWSAAALWFLLAVVLTVVGIWTWHGERNIRLRISLSILAVAIMGGLSIHPVSKQYRLEHRHPIPPTPAFEALRNRPRTVLPPRPDSMIYYDTPSIPVLSPDGAYVAAVVARRTGGSRIMITPSTHSDWADCVSAPESGPWWSTDSKSLFYVTTGRDGIRRVMETVIPCGSPTPHVEMPPGSPFAGGSANRGGYLLVSMGGALYYGHKTDAELAVLLRPRRAEREWALTNPQFGVDGNQFLYTVLNVTKREDAVHEASVAVLLRVEESDRRGRGLFKSDTHAEFLTPSCLLAGSRGDLMAHAYSSAGEARPKPPTSLSVPSELDTFVGRNQNLRGAFSVGSGRLAYFREVSVPSSLGEFVPFERHPDTTLDVSPGTENPSVSPDGSSVILASRAFVGQDRTLYKITRGSKDQTLLTKGGTGDNADPVWSPAGAVLFSSDRIRPRSLYLLKPGSPLGGEQWVGAPQGSTGVTPSSWAADGRLLVRGNIGDRYGLFVLSNPFAKRYSLIIPKAWSGQFSPHGGRWIAYHAMTDDHLEVFAIKADGSSSRPVNVSQGRGYLPRWGGDGAVFFVRDTGPSDGSRLLMSATFDERSGKVGIPTERADYRLAGSPNAGNYAFLPNGNLLMLYNKQDALAPQHEVVDLR